MFDVVVEGGGASGCAGIYNSRSVFGSVEGFGLPFRCQHFEVTPGILVLLDGLKERLEVSCPKALEGEQTHTDG